MYSKVLVIQGKGLLKVLKTFSRFKQWFLYEPCLIILVSLLKPILMLQTKLRYKIDNLNYCLVNCPLCSGLMN